MLVFAYDEIAYDAALTRVVVRPNCQVPGGSDPPPLRRYACGNLVPMCLLDRSRLRFERTDLLVRDGRPFVYPLELRFPLRATLTADSELAPGIPLEVLRQVRAGRAAVLVWIGHEPVPLHLDDAGKTWLFDTIQKFVRDHDLPPRQVWLVSGNVLAVHHFASWLRTNRRYEPETFRFVPLVMSPATVRMQYLANERGEDIDLSESRDAWTFTRAPLSSDAFAERYVQPSEIAEERRTGRLRPKRFLSMNRLHRPHRQVIVTYLSAKGLLDGSIVSFSQAPLDLYDGCKFPIEAELLRESWRQLQPRLPLVIDSAAGGVSINYHRVAFGWPYRDAYFNIVTETEMGRDVAPIITEKLMKPMLNYQPFIAASTAHTVRYLIAIGFRDFGPTIDPTYDQVHDPIERIRWIFREIDRLGAIGQAEARDRYFECLPALEHNRAHLLEGRHALDDLFDALEAQLG